MSMMKLRGSKRQQAQSIDTKYTKRQFVQSDQSINQSDQSIKQSDQQSSPNQLSRLQNQGGRVLLGMISQYMTDADMLTRFKPSGAVFQSDLSGLPCGIEEMKLRSIKRRDVLQAGDRFTSCVDLMLRHFSLQQLPMIPNLIRLSLEYCILDIVNPFSNHTVTSLELVNTSLKHFIGFTGIQTLILKDQPKKSEFSHLSHFLNVELLIVDQFPIGFEVSLPPLV